MGLDKYHVSRKVEYPLYHYYDMNDISYTLFRTGDFLHHINKSARRKDMMPTYLDIKS